MRINTDDHRPRFGRRSYAVGHGLASSDCGPSWSGRADRTVTGRGYSRPLWGHGHPVSWLSYEWPAGDDRQVSSQDRRSVKLRVRRVLPPSLLLPRPYLVLTKPLRLDIQCQRGASVKIGWKYLDD